MRIGRTALLRATGMGCLQLVKHLLQLGADPGVVNSSSRKPLTGAGEVSGQPQFESLYPRLLMASQPQHLVHQPWAQAAVVHCGRVSPVVEQELHHAQVAVPCGHEEGGPPAHIPRLEVDVGLAEEESHHLLPATPGSPHQRGVAVPVLGVGVHTTGQQDSGKIAQNLTCRGRGGLHSRGARRRRSLRPYRCARSGK